jgi:hypothetical protein
MKPAARAIHHGLNATKARRIASQTGTSTTNQHVNNKLAATHLSISPSSVAKLPTPAHQIQQPTIRRSADVPLPPHSTRPHSILESKKEREKRTLYPPRPPTLLSSPPLPSTTLSSSSSSLQATSTTIHPRTPNSNQHTLHPQTNTKRTASSKTRMKIESGTAISRTLRARYS